MKNRIVIIMIILLMLSGCTNVGTTDEMTTPTTDIASQTSTDNGSTNILTTHIDSTVILESIQIDETTLNDSYELGHIDFKDVALILNFNHDLESYILLDESMIVEPISDITAPGTYEINVSYLNFETDFFIEVVEAPNVIGIEIDEDSFNPYALISSFDISEILIDVELENGEIKKVPLSVDMIIQNDLGKLFIEGFHEINIRYSGFQTSFNIAMISKTPENNPLYNLTGEAAIFHEVFDLLYENHYKEPSIDLLYKGATQGMIDILEDRFTTLFNEDRYSSFYGTLSDLYIGTGIIPSIVDDKVVVGSIIENSPAEDAGVLVDDIILSINNVPITIDNISDIYSTIVGETNVDVSFELERLGFDETIELTITTAEVSIEPITYKVISSNNQNIGYISVSNFTTEADEKFEEALLSLESQNIDGLIVDLRNNGGGYIGTVTNMLQLFLLDNGAPLFQMDYRNSLNIYWGILDEKKSYNIITLVNGGTASASEVFASSMQEHGEYEVIGERTYGKGIAQITRSLKSADDLYLHISHAKWLTSNGNWIHEDGGSNGIIPDIIVAPNELELASKIFLYNDQQLTYDSINDKNINLQIILNGMGYDVRTDGYYDQATQSAVENIQSTHGLEITGNVNVQTVIIINEWLESYQSMTDSQLDYVIDYISSNTQPK